MAYVQTQSGGVRGLCLLAVPYTFVPTQNVHINGVDYGISRGTLDYPMPGYTVHDALAVDVLIFAVESSTRNPGKFVLCAFEDGGHETYTSATIDPARDGGVDFFRSFISNLKTERPNIYAAATKDGSELRITLDSIDPGLVEARIIRYTPPAAQ
jgi:hypothetical protein